MFLIGSRDVGSPYGESHVMLDRDPLGGGVELTKVIALCVSDVVFALDPPQPATATATAIESKMAEMTGSRSRRARWHRCATAQVPPLVAPSVAAFCRPPRTVNLIGAPSV